MLEKLTEWLSIDSRSLAVFRVLLAGILLVDLSVRLPWIEAFCTDSGILPRSIREGFYAWPGMWSLHTWSGGSELQYGLFALAALFAVMLGLGWQTRLATVASWVLLTSLHNRNIMVLNTGDDLLRTLLFWSMLLPLGAAWSLDARNRNEEAPGSVLHPAGGLLMLNMFLVYWVVVLRRHGMDEWFGVGNAVWLALMIEGYTTDIGIFVRDRMTWTLKPLTWLTMLIEAFGPLLCFSPWKTGPMRMLAVGLFLGLHISLGVMMEIGLFWFVSCTSWVIFVPPWFWDRVGNRVDGLQISSGIDRSAPVWATGIGAIVMVLALLTNYDSLKPQFGVELKVARKQVFMMARAVRMDQGWNVYSPPGRQDAWHVTAGTLEDGRVIDLWTQASPPVLDPPADIGDSYVNQRWRRFLFHMTSKRRIPVRQSYANWAARDWERRNPGDHVVKVELTQMTVRTLRKKKGKIDVVPLGAYATP